jgi:hypothetical protein
MDVSSLIIHALPLPHARVIWRCSYRVYRKFAFMIVSKQVSFEEAVAYISTLDSNFASIRLLVVPPEFYGEKGHEQQIHAGTDYASDDSKCVLRFIFKSSDGKQQLRL